MSTNTDIYIFQLCAFDAKHERVNVSCINGKLLANESRLSNYLKIIRRKKASVMILNTKILLFRRNDTFRTISTFLKGDTFYDSLFAFP